MGRPPRQPWVPVLVEGCGSGVLAADVARRYAQSTSGRRDSHLTAPRDSLSMSITNDSRSGCPTDIALRRYPMVVLQRAAKPSCDSRSREFRYSLSDSIHNSLLNGKSESIPNGNLPLGNRDYDIQMAKPLTRQEQKQVRFLNFDALMLRYGNSPKEFCERTGYKSETTISQLKNRQKSFGVDLGRQIAEAAGLEPLALENPDGIESSPQPARPKPPRDWPFSFSYQTFMSLPARKRREMDEAFSDMVVGAQASQLVDHQKRRG